MIVVPPDKMIVAAQGLQRTARGQTSWAKLSTWEGQEWKRLQGCWPRKLVVLQGGTAGRDYEACGLRGRRVIDGQWCGGLGQGEELLGRELLGRERRGSIAGGVGEVPSDGLLI
jgi:hypothetical protein